ncbi:PadR family transcriptional regulator [Pseudofrankia inefficax]|uniref:Transcriptional regulator PadR family protein n=1 Tax=Pseudofrankia inefficax (strain DSM 45817 / CECT 9037 / DDB 130130 / EuI1c) TaxID=298654 RepID=E3J2J3_PSEI1|nr:PadR family transcriptional regulator [Pseudofrankia inefficax]ADP80507.1 transcriptional regulator PadR family protein [Pseudofrankia inefficax]
MTGPRPDVGPDAADEEGAATPGGLPATAYAVLGQLAVADVPLSPVELKTRADFSLRFFYWAPAISHIRKELARLEQLGLVTSSPAPGRGLRRTLVHEITPAGRAVLRDWLHRTPDDEPVVIKHPVLLRVWLAGESDDPDRVVEILDHHLAQTRAAIDELRWGRRRAREVRLADRPELRYSGAVGDYVLRRMYAELANITQLRDELAALPTTPRPPFAGPPPLHDYAADPPAPSAGPETTVRDNADDAAARGPVVGDEEGS